jgi:hypothetical protein
MAIVPCLFSVKSDYQGMAGSLPVTTRKVTARARITDHQSTESFFMEIFLSARRNSAA